MNKKTVFVFAPNAVVGNWQKNIKQFSNYTESIKIINLADDKHRKLLSTLTAANLQTQLKNYDFVLGTPENMYNIIGIKYELYK